MNNEDFDTGITSILFLGFVLVLFVWLLNLFFLMALSLALAVHGKIARDVGYTKREAVFGKLGLILPVLFIVSAVILANDKELISSVGLIVWTISSFIFSFLWERFLPKRGHEKDSKIYRCLLFIHKIFCLIASPFLKLLKLAGLDLEINYTLVDGEDPCEEEVMILGEGQASYLTDNNLNYHTQIIGGSGVGKTNLLKLMIEDRIKKGHGVIFFDFKADIELMDWIAGVCEKEDVTDSLSVISMSDPEISHRYNPLGYGNETEITSQLMNSLNWSDSYYRDVAENALIIIIKAFCFRRERGIGSFGIGDLYLFLTDASARMNLVTEIHKYEYPQKYRNDLRRVCEDLSTKKRDNYQGLINQFSKIINSSAGDILCGNDPTIPEFSFKEAFRVGGVSYLFMNSLRLKETASVVGKLMLQDLMKTVGCIYDERGYQKKPITLIIDEFSSFATPDFGEFIEKARGAGVGVVVAYQSLQSLKSAEGDLMIKLNENTATKIAFQIQDSDDAQWFAGLLGTKTVERETYQTEEGFIFDRRTGVKSVRESEEYIIHPNNLKNLDRGEALLVCSKVDPHFGIVKINLANEYSSEYKRASICVGNISKSMAIDFSQNEDLLCKPLVKDMRMDDFI